MTFTYIDLFAGAGGLSVGFGNAGFDLIFANDYAPDAVRTFQYNLKRLHPEMNDEDASKRVIYGDITRLYELLGVGSVQEQNLGHIVVETARSRSLKARVPDVLENEDIRSFLSEIHEVDVVCGGPPCQGFSMIGRSKRGSKEERMKGFVDDPRNQLFMYFLKFVEKLNPKIVLIENVSGLGSASGYKDLIEEQLRSTGNEYEVDSSILNAAKFGIPQHRERMFFIGIRKDVNSVLKASSPKQIFKLLREKDFKSVSLWEAIDDLPVINSNPKPNNYDKEAEVEFGKSGSFGCDESIESYSRLCKNTSAYVHQINTYQGKEITPEKLFNHKARYQNEKDLWIYSKLKAGLYLNDPQNAEALEKVTYGIVDKNGTRKVSGFADKYFKLHPDKISKTIIAHLEVDGNSYVHPGKNPRSITPREAARIQSFPDWYKFTGTTRNQFRQIGNAVPPLLAFEIASVFQEILDKYSAITGSGSKVSIHEEEADVC
jgi:DNA (cytosine-5)-methyltransferase 1